MAIGAPSAHAEGGESAPESAYGNRIFSLEDKAARFEAWRKAGFAWAGIGAGTTFAGLWLATRGRWRPDSGSSSSVPANAAATWCVPVLALGAGSFTGGLFLAHFMGRKAEQYRRKIRLLTFAVDPRPGAPALRLIGTF